MTDGLALFLDGWVEMEESSCEMELPGSYSHLPATCHEPQKYLWELGKVIGDRLASIMESPQDYCGNDDE